MKSVPFLQVLILLALTGCGTLDTSGVYKGNKVLYDADVVIATSYDVIHSFVLWEYQNREVIKTMSPQIKEVADRMRLNAPKWFASAVALRDQYKLSSTAANATALQTALDVLRAAMAEASNYLATQPLPGGTTPPPTPPK